MEGLIVLAVELSAFSSETTTDETRLPVIGGEIVVDLV